MEAHIRFDIIVPDHLQDWLIAELSEWSFEGFEQHDRLVSAYIPQSKLTDSIRDSLEQWLRSQSQQCYVEYEERIEQQNWNRQWEESITARPVGRFLIKPTWSEVAESDELITLYVDPKMSFGTGYHETTRLMLYMLPDYVKGGEQVLDVGSGTGILAIAALKLGAERARAVDNDQWCYDNGTENAQLNGVVTRMQVEQVDLDQTDAQERLLAGRTNGYDLMIANINRNVLIEHAELLAGLVAEGGTLLLSGLLTGDEAVVLRCEAYQRMQTVQRQQENEWVGLALARK